jgi:Uma2 family endonuclease
MVTGTAGGTAVGPSVVLYGIDWATYGKLVEAAEGSQVRMTYQRGNLEIMAPSWNHEWWSGRVDVMFNAIGAELDLDFQPGGSTTYRREGAGGLEPDKSYYFGANARHMTGPRQLDLRRDPPPDLALEVEITRSVIDRLEIYAALGVPEVWRYERGRLHILHLRSGNFVEATKSRNLPFLTVSIVGSFLRETSGLRQATLLRFAAKWARETARPLWEAYRRKTARESGSKKERKPRRRTDDKD